MSRYVLRFQEIDQSRLAMVGGKAANLARLTRIEGIDVPSFFCVTTDAFLRMLSETPVLHHQIDLLSRLKPDDREQVQRIAEDARAVIERTTIPPDVAAEITRALAELGENAACAVRSSATAEDSPAASFAGQQDSYLNVTGIAAVLEHVVRCWASLFTERAVIYRMRNGFDHRQVHMAVIVQQMVSPQAAGVLFTADPVTGNRRVASVEATHGLGEALVSGTINADRYQVRDGRIVEKAVSSQASLSDAQVVDLVGLGRRIEAAFGEPQDIEWCLVDDDFAIVQARPITTLFPVPAAEADGNHVYISVGHQQMMTDAMRPLGISVWQLTAGRPMYHAGGRLFVDVTRELAAPASRKALIEGMGRTDPLIRDALQTVVDRTGFIPLADDDAAAPPPRPAHASIETDPAIPARLIAGNQASLEALQRDIAGKSGDALLDFILSDIQEMKRVLFDPLSYQVILAGMEATWWLNEKLHEWLGEKNAADTLAQSAPNNITSEMGLALLDVADAIRPHREVVEFLETAEHDANFLDALRDVPGGREARAAFAAFLDKYGMRCVGEIDITRPRWREAPNTLLPAILGNIRNFEHGAARRLYEQGEREARSKEDDVLRRLRSLPDGDAKAEEASRMIERLRAFVGYREYPKYSIVSRYFIYKRALLAEAERLVRARVLERPTDIFYLTFQELHDAVRTRQADDDLIRERRAAFRAYQALTPPRILTSEGEGIAGAYGREGVPAGALVGLAVSAGTVEGRARVITDIAQADLQPGDILVTAFTDPSWTPVFVAIEGLVTEVGGLMTHGAVIAREYGLPAVVGVEHATRLIRDGDRIRVNGTEGFVEILSRGDRPA